MQNSPNELREVLKRQSSSELASNEIRLSCLLKEIATTQHKTVDGISWTLADCGSTVNADEEENRSKGVSKTPAELDQGQNPHTGQGLDSLQRCCGRWGSFITTTHWYHIVTILSIHPICWMEGGTMLVPPLSTAGVAA